MPLSGPDILLPFCCPSNPIPHSSKPSKEISTFLAALHSIRDARLSKPKSPTTTSLTSTPTSSSRPTSSTSSDSTVKPTPQTNVLFSPYPSMIPLPRTLILLQTTHPSPAPNQQRFYTRQYFAQLPGKDYWSLEMWPQEGFGGVSERRVEDLWARGGNWVGRESLGRWGGGGGDGKDAVGGRGKAREGVEDRNEGIGGEGDRVGWKCRCGREYWVRVVRFAEGERGWEDLERGGKSLGVSTWEMVD